MYKKRLKSKNVFILLCFFLCSNVHAHGLGTFSLLKEKEWTPLQLGLWPVALYREDTKVYGLNLNLLASDRWSATYGVTISPLLFHELGEVKGVTIGLYSIIDDSHSGVLISLLSKVSANNGLQLGVFNICSPSYYEDSCGGVQIGVVNVSDASCFQIGLFNDSKASALQIGLLNHNPNALIKWLPLINFSKRF